MAQACLYCLMRKEVSVIIPTYNRPGYLAQAVFSVLEQTCSVSEIIIVDDGSSQINRARIDELKDWDERIRVIHLPENRGVSAARNRGLKESKGEYILFLDDDDLLKSQMVESNLQVFVADPEADVVSSGYAKFFDANGPDNDWEYEQRHKLFPEKILAAWDYGDSGMLKERPFSALLRKSLQVSSSLIRRKAIGATRFAEDLTRGEDKFFWLVLADSGCSFMINHEQLGFYRLHNSNSSSNPGLWKSSLESRLKLLGDEFPISLHDRLIIQKAVVSLLSNYVRLQKFKHISYAFRILFSFQMISYWPILLKAISAKIYSKWKNCNVRACRIIESCKDYESKGKT